MRHEIEQAMTDLERQGLIVRTGEYRRNREGILEAVYVTRQIYAHGNDGSNRRCRKVPRRGGHATK